MPLFPESPLSHDIGRCLPPVDLRRDHVGMPGKVERSQVNHSLINFGIIVSGAEGSDAAQVVVVSN